MTDFPAFLQRHAENLATVSDRATLSAWHRHFATEWSREALALTTSANEHLGLTDQEVIQPDVGYLAVERRARSYESAEPWILVAGNPGWHERANATERGIKGQASFDQALDVDAYERFRQAFFDKWYQNVIVASGRGGGPDNWWNDACRFLHELSGLEKPLGLMTLDPSFDVIGWWLWPFHSTRDGLTRSQMDERSGLRGFALASLEAALRMNGSKGVIAVGSAAAHAAEALVKTCRSQFGAPDRGALVGHGPRGRENVEVARHIHLATNRELIVIPRQILGVTVLPAELRDLLADRIRERIAFANPDTVDTFVRAHERRPRATFGERMEAGANKILSVKFIQAERGRPLVLSVPIGAVAQDVNQDSAQPADVFTQTVGYWSATIDGPVVRAMREAFAADDRVFLMARARGAILRLYEVVPGSNSSVPPPFVHHGDQLWVASEQPVESLLDASRRPFATAYHHGKNTRLRFHAVECRDEALRAAPIDSSVPMLQAPRLCTFEDLDDPRVKELLAAPPLCKDEP
jgi:hypothetical protein